MASRRGRRRDEPVHPLLARRPEKKALVLVLSADRGLCGAFNTNINKAAERVWARQEGRRGRGRVRDPRPQGPRVPGPPRRARSRRTSRASTTAWTSRRRGWSPLARRPASRRASSTRVYLVYNEFKSAITQKVTRRAAAAARHPRRSGRPGRRAERAAPPRRRPRRPERLHLRARPARAARAARADVRRDHASTAPCSRARRASSARR